MSDESMPPHEVAYQAVREYQDAQSRSESRWKGPSVEYYDKKTSAIVWGALFGLIIGACKVDLNAPVTLVPIPVAGMAIGGTTLHQRTEEVTVRVTVLPTNTLVEAPILSREGITVSHANLMAAVVPTQ